MELTAVREIASRLREQVHRVVVGQDAALDLLLVSLLCEGHVLFEGVPGVAKTLLTRVFASTLPSLSITCTGKFIFSWAECSIGT